MGTHYRGTPAETRALNAYIKLMRAMESVTARTSAAPESEGLTLSQFGALEAIYHLGPLCQRALAQKLLKSTGNIVLVVDNLEKRHLAERRREGADRRFVTVHLTTQGRRLIRRVLPRHVRAIVQAMSVLSGRQQDALGGLCRRLGRAQAGRR